MFTLLHHNYFRKKVNQIKMKKLLPKIWRFVKRTVIAFFIFTIALTIIYRFVNPPYTMTMASRKIEAIFSDKKNKDIDFRWKNYEDISRYLPLAIITCEDQAFPHHFGFDFKAIDKAIEHNEKVKAGKRKRIKGASTISQQVAKNVFLWQGRSFIRKGLEVYFTLLIEFFWPKQRIIEVYMNIAEMGNMTFGAEAAAQKYFRKPAAKLTQSEAATIAVILPNPRKYSAASPGPYVQKRRNWCIDMMNKLGGKSFLKQVEG
jgi:monofunctional biosynthetic peptidoglycan transglycosylase